MKDQLKEQIRNKKFDDMLVHFADYTCSLAGAPDLEEAARRRYTFILGYFYGITKRPVAISEIEFWGKEVMSLEPSKANVNGQAHKIQQRWLSIVKNSDYKMLD